MSLDPLNVGLFKTCGENLVIAFSCYFFLVDDERDFILRMQITSAALFQQIDMKHILYISHF